MVGARKITSSPYQVYSGDFGHLDRVTCKLGSRDDSKTHGRATEEYFQKVLPILGFEEGVGFKIDQLDGTCEGLKFGFLLL